MVDLYEKKKEGCLKLLIWPFLGLIGYIFITSIAEREELDKSTQFTFGVIKGRLSASGQNSILYEYSYNDKTYVGAEIFKKEYYKKGNKYLVKILPKNPDVSSMLFDLRVKDSVTYVPFDGWDTIPVNLLHDSVSKNIIKNTE